MRLVAQAASTGDKKEGAAAVGSAEQAALIGGKEGGTAALTAKQAALIGGKGGEQQH